MELIATLVDINGMIPILNNLPDQEQSTYLAVGITWSVLNSHYTKQTLVNFFTHVDR